MKGIDNTSDVTIKTPLTIQSKLTCSSCGKIFKSSFKYCPNCGTYLE
jgi:rRNA maturation endonuclease Nob1